MAERIQFLDGFRGVAILAVLGFHTYARWPEVMPYGKRFADIPVFSLGWLGVNLFFLISGFVILMTLETASNPREFLLRRWIRLFPGMLVCTILIIATASLFPERPYGSIQWQQALPGLLFIDTDWMKFVLPSLKQPIEGVFWSIFVEFKFYVFAAATFFFAGQRLLIPLLSAAFGLSCLAKAGTHHYPSPLTEGGANMTHLFSFEYFGWFASGALFYRYYKNRDHLSLWAGLLFSVASAIHTCQYLWKLSIAAILISCLFAISVALPVSRRLLTSKILLFMGSISYPLYLLHENALVSMTVKLGKVTTFGEWGFFLPWLPIMVLIGVSTLVAKIIEPMGQKHLKSWFIRLSNSPATNLS